MMLLQEVQRRAREFEAAAHKIFGINEASPSRVIQLHASYAKLGSLTVKQDDMLRQALRCVEMEVFRAAHVLAWAALIDYLEEYSARDGFAAVNAARPTWKITSLDALRENQTEFSVIEAMKVAGLITKGEQKAFHGLLHRRNECAHPSDYYPDLNQSLGYISEILTRLEKVQKRIGPALP